MLFGDQEVGSSTVQFAPSGLELFPDVSRLSGCRIRVSTADIRPSVAEIRIQ